MLRSMFTAVSALNLHQTYLDVIADNLANANTPGFKANRAIFQDQISQLMSPEAAPTATGLGGKNPTQVGMGVQIGSTLTLFTQGMLQATGRNQDVSIQGDGFLIYRAEDGMRYSREGSLTLDAAGYLVNSSTGMRVQGWMKPDGSAINTASPTVDIQATLDRTIARATTAATLSGNLNPTDVPASTTVSFNAIDSLGAAQKVEITFARVDDNNWSWSMTQPTPATAPVNLEFNDQGQINDPLAAVGTITIPGLNGAASTTVALDFKGMTKLTTPGKSDVALTYQDGVTAGTVSDITIDSNTGMINLQFSNGLRQELGQLALARFNNSTGLLRKGHTSFAPSENSGAPIVGAAGTNGRGSITAGYLEASNVDMANEFTNMILAQRGFQAQTRVISTSDEILQELVNLKR